jgi:YidC/Oxa1 family membrane protein insertase
MDTLRNMLLAGLGLMVFLIYMAWQEDYGARPSAGAGTPVQVSGSDESGAPPAPAPGDERPEAPREALPAAAPAPAPQAAGLPSGRRIRVVTDLLDLEIDTVGGDLRRVDLPAYPVEASQPDVPFRLMYDEGQHLYIAQSGLVAKRGAPDFHTLDHYAEFSAARDSYLLEEGQDRLQVPLAWTHSSGLKITKLLTFHRNSYVVDVGYRVENGSNQDWQGGMYGQFQHSPVRDEDKPRFIATYTGGAVSGPEKHYEKIGFDEMAEQPLRREYPGGWAAILQHYFVAAWLPPEEQTNLYYSKVLDGPRYVLGFRGQSVQVPAGQSGSLDARIYLGPKEHNRLKEAAPYLGLTVDYGYLTVLADPIFWLLTKIHALVGNWGWAIIILTILIKAAFFHLSATSYKSMAHMRKVQPRLKALKDRYGDDRQKLNQAMMELYKREKINPLGGCLPILVQIPVFIALYWVLLESVELRQADFMFWLNDLSSKDPYFVLPIIMGITMVVQQKLNPAPLDPIQAKVMMALPLVFTVFFAFFPAGLVLYWVVNNALSIAQQWYITRKLVKD